MHFAYDEDQELMRSSIDKHLEDRQPLSALRALIDSDAETTFDRSIWREGAQLGWFAMLAGADAGGGSITNQPVVDLAAISEVLGRHLYPGPFLETNLVVGLLVDHGDDSAHRSLVEQMVAGDVVATLGASCDATLRGSAVDVRMSPGAEPATVTLNGQARFVRDVPSGDVLLAFATTDDGLAAVVVPTGSTGLGWRRLNTIDISRRFYEVSFADVVLPSSAVVVAGSEAADALAKAAQLAIVVQSAESAAAAAELLRRTVSYLQIREQFGRTIASFQAIKHRLADLYTDVAAAQAAARYAAMAVADHRPDQDEAVAVAGAFVKEAFANLCSQALQLHGGIGFTWEHDLHLFLRRSKADEWLFGSSEDNLDLLFSIIDARTA